MDTRSLRSLALTVFLFGLGAVGQIGCKARTAVKVCPDGLILDARRTNEGKGQWCISPDGVRSRWTDFYPDGKKRKRTCGFANGKAEGSYLSWHESGKVSIEGVYKDGEKIGKWSQWNDKGVLVARGEYRFGRFIAGAPIGAQVKCENLTP